MPRSYVLIGYVLGTIVGFAVLKSCSKYFKHIPILGGDFGPRENNIVQVLQAQSQTLVSTLLFLVLQTAATAAGGMSSVFVSAFPALYQLNLLSTPSQDYWRIVALTAVGGYFGFAFATPRTS